MENCNQCGSALKLIPAGVSKKTGKPYNAFMSCPNKCQNATDKKPYAAKKDLSDEFVQLMNFIAPEFVALNKRLDAMGKYLKSKMDTPQEKMHQVTEEVDMSQIEF